MSTPSWDPREWVQACLLHVLSAMTRTLLCEHPTLIGLGRRCRCHKVSYMWTCGRRTAARARCGTSPARFGSMCGRGSDCAAKGFTGLRRRGAHPHAGDRAGRTGGDPLALRLRVSSTSRASSTSYASHAPRTARRRTTEEQRALQWRPTYFLPDREENRYAARKDQPRRQPHRFL